MCPPQVPAALDYRQHVAGPAEREPMPKQVVEIDEPALLAILGKNITTARERRNLTILALAEAAGVDRIFLGRIERGERNPTAMFLTRVAVALNTTTAALLRGVDPR